jgi:uncharacterized protein YbjT (DUF2867 family)
MYAVIGVTGKVGGGVAQHLLEAGESVRAVVRDSAKARPWAARGCELALADIADPEALARAFTGTQGVFVLLPPVFDPAPGFPESLAAIGALKTALAQARPERVVCLSSVGAQAQQPSLLNPLGWMERELGELPLPTTFLRAAWFMENFIYDVPAVHTGVFPSFLQPLDHPIPMVATADVGRVAAELLRASGQDRRIVELESERRICAHDVAGAFASALGIPVHAHEVPRDEWESLFRSHGMKNPLPRMQMLDGFNAGWIDFEAGAALTQHGKVGLHEAIAALLPGVS